MDILLPELGEGVQTAVVACWHKKPGEQVLKDDDIAEFVTDKASFNVPAICSGILTEVLYEEGQEAKIGEPIARIKVQEDKS